MSNPRVAQTHNKWAELLTYVPLAASLVALLVYSRKSLDFSDESLYLYLTASPTQESTLAGVWNWYLNLIYRLSGEDIVLYRQISVVISFACSYLFAWSYFSSTSNPKNTKIGIRLSLLPIMLTTVSCVFFYRYTLITPGYNWLAFIGVLLSISGAVKWLSGDLSLIWPAISVIGLGLATIARPTAGIIVLLAMLSYQKIRTDILRVSPAGKVFFATMISFVVLHHLFVVSISATIKALQRTYLVSQVDESHSFVNLLTQAATDVEKLPLMAVSISNFLILIPVCFIFSFFVIKSKQLRTKVQVTLVLGSLSAFGILIVWKNALAYDPGSGNKIGQTLATLTLFGFLVAFSFRRTLSAEQNDLKVPISSEYSGSAPVLLLAGIVGYAFSSNNGLLSQSAGIGILYVALYLRYILRIGPQDLAQKILLFNVIFLLIVNAQVLHGAWQNPYRSVSLSENTYPVIVGGDSKILVSKSRAEDISKVKALSSKIDADNKNLYLVDLSPFTTFIPYQLEFKTIESPLIFHVNNLEGLAQRNRSPLLKAWILTSNSNTSVAPNELMEALGKSFEDDYELAYTLEGTYCRNLPCKLFLWKPI